jgi:hypothetical protein
VLVVLVCVKVVGCLFEVFINFNCCIVVKKLYLYRKSRIFYEKLVFFHEKLRKSHKIGIFQYWLVNKSQRIVNCIMFYHLVKLYCHERKSRKIHQKSHPNQKVDHIANTHLFSKPEQIGSVGFLFFVFYSIFNV